MLKYIKTKLPIKDFNVNICQNNFFKHANLATKELKRNQKYILYCINLFLAFLSLLLYIRMFLHYPPDQE